MIQLSLCLKNKSCYMLLSFSACSIPKILLFSPPLDQTFAKLLLVRSCRGCWEVRESQKCHPIRQLSSFKDILKLPVSLGPDLSPTWPKSRWQPPSPHPQLAPVGYCVFWNQLNTTALSFALLFMQASSHPHLLYTKQAQTPRASTGKECRGSLGVL